MSARQIGLLVVAAMIAGSCTKSPTTPTASTPSVPSPQPVLRITSPSNVVAEGANLPVTVQVVNGATVTDCSDSAAWASDNSTVLFSSSNGVVGRRSGFATLTASCNGLSTSLAVTVQGPARHSYVYPDDTAAPHVSIGGDVQFLDGPRAGQTVSVADLPSIDITGLTYPMKVHVSAPLYEARDVVLAEATSNAFNPDQSSNQQFTVPMKYVGDSSTDTFVNGFAGDPTDVTFPFTVANPGVVRLGLYWKNDDITHIESLGVDLTCGGQVVYQTTVRNLGTLVNLTLFSQPEPSGPCQAHVHRTEAGYRVVITYPH